MIHCGDPKESKEEERKEEKIMKYRVSQFKSHPKSYGNEKSKIGYQIIVTV